VRKGLETREIYTIINTINIHVVDMVNWYLVWSFIMLGVFLPAGIIMIVLYLYNDAKINFFGKQKLESEKNQYDTSTLEKWV
jgi:predicted metal-binding membrane protein